MTDKGGKSREEEEEEKENKASCDVAFSVIVLGTDPLCIAVGIYPSLIRGRKTRNKKCANGK